MNLNYLIDPNMQFQDRNGVNNVAGFLRVYYEGTDDRATTYKDFNGTMNPADIPLDNNGRAVVIADSKKEYRVEVYSASGAMLWTQHPVFPQGGGGSEYDGDVSDATATFTKDEGDTSEIASGSTLKVLFTKISKFFAGLKRVAFTGSYNDLSDKPDVKKGKLHRIGVRMVQEGDPSPKPMTDWIIDLESPNPSEPDGYDRLTVAKAKEIHNNGEVFAFTSYATRGLASNEDTYYESIFTSSSSYLNIVLTKTSNHQNPTEISRAVISDYGDYLGVTDASADSEYLNVTLVQEGGDVFKQNKIHRYSFGDGTVGVETPVYGLWLIDLDKPDPNGPEGYARVTPAEFWKSTAVNGEVPVYLQDKNANNSLTYAYLSRADVTKSGNTVTNVFAYFVRSGYGNDLASSVGFRFTKLPGSDYLQRATSTDDSFNARSVAGIAMTHQAIQSVDHTVTSGEASSGDIRIPLSHFDRGVYLLNIQLYAGSGSHFGSNHVPLRISFRYRFGGSDSWTLEHTGALEQVDQNGPWYYGSTIQLNTNLSSLTGIDLDIYFGANKVVENDIVGVKITYTLLSEPS